MAQYFAKIENNVVVKVAVVEREFLEANPERYTGNWVEMFIDQKMGHGGIGSLYDSTENVFYCPQPYPSWTLDSDYEWQPPTPFPADGSPSNPYIWNEKELEWVAL
jgi:hypothetical protein